jgi:signal transduction histidine kinase
VNLVWWRLRADDVRRWMRAAHRHPRWVDAAIALGLFAMTAALGADGPPSPHGGVLTRGLLLSGIACGALILRRRWPFPVLVVTIASAEAYLTLSQANEAVLAAPLIALYTVAETAGWRWSLTVGVPAVLALAGFHLLLRPSPDFGQENLTLFALGGLAIAAGQASRNRQAYIAEVEERARHAERDREQEAGRRVTEERLRIARDLHDVVGHHLALINVQAGVAAHVLDDQPAQAKQALDHIMDASRAGLSELRETIGLLREPGDPAAPTDPTEGLSGLPELIATFRRAGLRIDHEIEGAVRPIPSAADLTAYRVIQESLTNVRKHAGDVTTTVRLGYDRAGLRVVVEDDGNGGPAAQDGDGHGIAGMRERVAALGGSLDVGARPGGGFRVDALLPLPQEGGRS